MSTASAEVDVPAGDASAPAPAGTRLRSLDRFLLALAVLVPAGYVLWRIGDAFRDMFDPKSHLNLS